MRYSDLNRKPKGTAVTHQHVLCRFRQTILRRIAMKKRWLSIALAAVLAAAMPVSVMAEEAEGEGE